MKLVLKLIAGIVIGIILGLIAPDFLIRLLVTIKVVFGSFIGFIIPLIILFFIASGVGGLGKKSGRLVGTTVGLSYLFTVIAGLLAFVISITVIPFTSPEQAGIAEGTSFEPFLRLEITPIMGVVTALVAAFLFRNWDGENRE